MMMILKTFLLINFALIINAESRPYCELAPTPASKKVRVNDFPSFFFKVHPSGDYIGYIGSTGNQLLDLTNGKRFPLPGIIDPVFAPDGKHILIPLNNSHLNGPPSYNDQFELDEDEEENKKWFMGFYDFDKFKNASAKENPTKEDIKKVFSTPILKDFANKGLYQSASIEKDGKFNVITDKNKVSISSYSIDDNGINVEKSQTTVCQNLKKINFDLPMLSKDGKYLSFYNENLKTTQIYKFSPNGKCELALDLGIATGKVSFNSDSSQITFHIDSFSKNYGEYFSGVASDIYKDVYVLNLDEDLSNNLTPTTWAKVTKNEIAGNGSYYPDFSSNGDLFFLSDVDNYFEFTQVKQKDLAFTPFFSFPNFNNFSSQEVQCIQFDQFEELRLILGEMWLRTCKEIDYATINDSLLFSMGLSSKNCKELVLDKWNQEMAQKIKDGLKGINISVSRILDVDINDLLLACPTEDTQEVDTKVVGEWKKRNSQNFKEILTQKCLSCHSKEVSFEKNVTVRKYFDEDGQFVKSDKATISKTISKFDPENISGELATQMLEAISNPDINKRMPKGGVLKENEIAEFHNYVTQKKLELGSDEDISSDENYLFGSIYSKDALEKEMTKVIEDNTDYFSTNPELKEAMIESQRKFIWCLYGQVGCKELIVELSKKKREELSSGQSTLKEEDELKIQHYIDQLKCDFTFETTYDDCLKVRAKAK